MMINQRWRILLALIVLLVLVIPYEDNRVWADRKTCEDSSRMHIIKSVSYRVWGQKDCGKIAYLRIMSPPTYQPEFFSVFYEWDDGRTWPDISRRGHSFALLDWRGREPKDIHKFIPVPKLIDWKW